MKDEVLAELWQVKDQLARESGRDVRSLLAKLRLAQASSPHPTVNLARKRQQAEPAVATDSLRR
jgi:hypothetical protein